MSNQDEHVPKDPPVAVETPESRMTGEGGPPPEHEEEKGPEDGPEYETTEPAHEPEPHEPPD
ncbi:hypothetical protein F7Q99_32945 [Streptomyces kaniharaensis]|uniref:Uncharacterized protein n=1 Tax=Streptomyces kaniharaensis TaxID=212423 RepID=A0A6N7L2C5_9ACTN|nr:hypothetical protein [Streptomyces kaniharaensis]MQS16867.1 hypothetical protein [Streptomyces kaniharaensis]